MAGPAQSATHYQKQVPEVSWRGVQASYRPRQARGSRHPQAKVLFSARGVLSAVFSLSLDNIGEEISLCHTAIRTPWRWVQAKLSHDWLTLF
jgi:hypothetical protein